MSVLHSPDSNYAKEMIKWEAQGSLLGPGLRPYVKRDYPMMLHLAGQFPQGGVGILDTRVVESELQREQVESQGFRATPLEALEAFKTQQTLYATLSAEREWEKRHRMSPHAREEVEAIEDEAGAQHLPTIPERSRKPRGRPKKPAPVSVDA